MAKTTILATAPTSISWETKAYGWEGTLHKLNADRNDITLPANRRRAAARNHAKILRQLQDKHLMSLRQRFIKASQAGDATMQDMIAKEMRYYLHEDTETGL
jgi:hypothetical protein